MIIVNRPVRETPVIEVMTTDVCSSVRIVPKVSKHTKYQTMVGDLTTIMPTNFHFENARGVPQKIVYPRDPPGGGPILVIDYPI